MTHLLFRFRQASHGRSLLPRGVFPSLAEAVRFDLEAEVWSERWLEGVEPFGADAVLEMREGCEAIAAAIMRYHATLGWE